MQDFHKTGNENPVFPVRKGNIPKFRGLWRKFYNTYTKADRIHNGIDLKPLRGLMCWQQPVAKYKSS